MYFSLSINKPKFNEALKVISFQNDLYVLHGRSLSKGTIISKIHTFFYNIKHYPFHFACSKMLLTAMIQDD